MSLFKFKSGENLMTQFLWDKVGSELVISKLKKSCLAWKMVFEVSFGKTLCRIWLLEAKWTGSNKGMRLQQ